jgi:hypothetical protein
MSRVRFVIGTPGSKEERIFEEIMRGCNGNDLSVKTHHDFENHVLSVIWNLQ